METDLIQMLRQHGYRLTPQRIQVLQVVSSHQQHLTAEEIHTKILPQQPSLDIATVYRSLRSLQAVGLIAPLRYGDERTRYEYHPHGNQHHHAICHGCGSTLHIPADMVRPLLHEIAQLLHFVVDDHLTLPGVCDHCRTTPTE